jgi:hypothetical protein
MSYFVDKKHGKQIQWNKVDRSKRGPAFIILLANSQKNMYRYKLMLFTNDQMRVFFVALYSRKTK